MDETDRHRVQEVPFLATSLEGGHEPCLFQDAQVLHDPEARHLRQVPAQLTERLAIALVKPVEQHAAIGIAECPEDHRHADPSWPDYM